MNIDKYLENMQKIQKNILDFLIYENDIEENYQSLKDILRDTKIYDNQYEFKTVLYLIVKISNNMHREVNFFSKIERILLLFKEKITKYFSNSEIFHIFKSNKRILLFLLEENIMYMDVFIVKKLVTGKYLKLEYPQYFQPEIKPFLKEKFFQKEENQNLFYQISKELPESFYEKRKKGENDNLICQFIQKDSIEDFIIYINKNFVSVNSSIDKSIYETNSFLLKKQKILLIEYAAFFGSIQIFNYLRLNGAELTSLLWIYAIHGNNPEIIHFLEEQENLDYGINEMNKKYELLFNESIKCHHIDITNYIKNNYLQDEKENLIHILIQSLKCYNFIFIQSCHINEYSFHYLCKYDYFLLVSTLLQQLNIDINNSTILSYCNLIQFLKNIF